jgi:hypothetical protein
MRVIRPGVLPDTKEYYGHCVYCHCAFTFMRGEAKFESTCRNEDYLKIACPTCKREVWVRL